jgi:hypothetical protein
MRQVALTRSKSIKNSHRSFEFDRYPFDEEGAVFEYRVELTDVQAAYGALDITHGMEIEEDQHHRDGDSTAK